MSPSMLQASTQGLSEPSPGLLHETASGKLPALQVQQVLRHVATLVKGLPSEAALERLAEAARTCGHLMASRRQLAVALNTRQSIERVAQLALGRSPGGFALPADHESLCSVQANMQLSVNNAMGHWRRAGQGFARHTHLLPTQLDQHMALPPPLTAQQQQALVACFVRSGTEVPVSRFDAAMASYMAAHRRCQWRVGPALAARERRRRTELDGPGGRASLANRAMALFDEFLSRQSLLAAEGERAGALYELQWMAVGYP